MAICWRLTVAKKVMNSSIKSVTLLPFPTYQHGIDVTVPIPPLVPEKSVCVIGKRKSVLRKIKALSQINQTNEKNTLARVPSTKE